MTARRGYISESVHGGRVVSHGKIADLSQGFALSGGQSFSIYIRPRQSVTQVDTVLSVKCANESEFSEAPFPYNEWSPLMIREIAPENGILEVCDIYWGSGEIVD
jgi:hypothetical protein